MSQKPARHIFVDLETTGLDCERDEITELGWVFEKDGELMEQHRYTLYSGFPSLWSARNTASFDISVHSATTHEFIHQVSLNDALYDFFGDFLDYAEGGRYDVYLVGACPAFDDRFLRKVFREVPYHYHVICVETLVMGLLKLPAPPSVEMLEKITGVRNKGHHNALEDALYAKVIFDWWLAESRA
jgi:DNA polymerase III epsilon subunit-like protein